MRNVIVLAGLAACCAGPTVRPEPRVGKPKLVVLIVVDQYPTWTFERDRPHFRGGLERLLREGAYVAGGELPFANTFTATGHATIGTGALPSVHGIVGNTWYRRDTGKETWAESDPAAPLHAVGKSQGGVIEAHDAASGKAMRVDGIADSLARASAGKARSIAIALKPRASAFVIGRKPELAIWYESAAGGMTTTRAYAAEPPGWLVELARTKPASRFFSETWNALDRDLLASVTGIGDASPGEGTVHQLDSEFPHPLAGNDAARAFLHTPFADEVVFDAAYASLDALALGADDVPDLLALGFNAHDYAGHLWGPDSWEALDLSLRFDLALGRFFDELDRRYSPNGWAVVFTSDHGATPIVDRAAKGRPKIGRRIPTPELVDVIEAAVKPHLGDGPWVASIVSNNVWLKANNNDAALDAAAAALAKVPNVAAAGRSDRCEPRDELSRVVCASIVPGESGDLYVFPQAGSLVTDYKTGTHHDAPFDDNRRVPILVRAPGLRPQTGSGTLLQVAPTVAALLGIPPPPSATEPALFGLR